MQHVARTTRRARGSITAPGLRDSANDAHILPQFVGHKDRIPLGIIAPMPIPPVSRRQFLATGSALLAGTCGAGVGRGVSVRARRRRPARRGRGGGARARGGARRLLRRHPHQPLPPRIDRDARAAGAERLALDQLRPRPARAGQRRVGLRRDQSRRAGRRRARSPSRPSPSPAPTPRWPRARSCSPTPTRSSPRGPARSSAIRSRCRSKRRSRS